MKLHPFPRTEGEVLDPTTRRSPLITAAVIVALLFATVVAAAAPASAVVKTVAATKTVAAKATAATKAAAAKKAVAAATATTQRSCATPAPGQYACLALRRTDLKALTARANVSPNGFGPANLQSAYALPSATSGGGQTVALVDAYDNPNAESDLAVYRAQYGLPACTTANGCFRKVNESGQASPLPVANADWAGEESLDVDMVSAICPNCHILLVEATSASNDLFTSVNTAVSLGAKFVSMSFGGNESSGDLSIDTQDLTHPGVVITASAGDSGTGAQYPSSSSKVISVGGTSLTAASNARGWTETTWSGSGSGCSAFEPALAYQNGLSSCPLRAANDISAVSDPNTGLAVYQTYGGGGWTVYGGTSAASPIVSAAYALAGTRPASDNPGADLYTHKSQLNDVVTGRNGSCQITIICTAGPGWDGPTGLGTPNGIAALAATGGGTAPTPVVTVTNPGNQTTLTNTAVSLPISASDSAGQALTYTQTNLPAGLGISSSTGLITGKPTTAGTSSVTVKVTDASGSTQSVTFTWTVTSSGTGPGPIDKVTISNPGNQSTVVNTAVRVQVTGTDSLGQALTFRSTGLPAGLTINASSGLITGTPTAVATYSVTVSVTDPSGSSASAGFSWTISAATTPPPSGRVTIVNPGNKVTQANIDAVYLELIGADTAPVAVTFQATGLPAGLTIIPAYGLIKGIPTTVGTSQVTVTASDASGASASTTFTWTIKPATSPAAANTVTMANPGPQSTPAGSTVHLQIVADDSAGAGINFVAVGLPDGLSIGSSSGLITGWPLAGSSGPVTIYVRDGSGYSASVTFMWNITGS